MRGGQACRCCSTARHRAPPTARAPCSPAATDANGPPVPVCPRRRPQRAPRTPPTAYRWRSAAPILPLHAPAARLAGRLRFRPFRYASRESSPDGRYARRTPAHPPRCNGPGHHCDTVGRRGLRKTGPAGSARRSAPGGRNSAGPDRLRRRCTTRLRHRSPAIGNCCRARRASALQSRARSAHRTRRWHHRVGTRARWTPPSPRSAHTC
ncbi:hypothetical protein [Pseudomonas sp. 24 E 13]|nr:hypothetical protein [Pseudomonas sp. 24 E 13]